MAERSNLALFGAFLTFVWSLLAVDASAHRRHDSMPDKEMRLLSAPDKFSPAQLQGPSNMETHIPANPYAGMSCLQLYVLAMERQNEVEEKEFSKKDCGSL